MTDPLLPDPLLIDPTERPATAYMGVEAMSLAQVAASAPPPELAPRRRARRRTLPATIPAAAPGAPGDPTACTCDPARWRGIGAGRVRHEPTCPRRTAPR